ncbi:TauD/TfdA family dioxygenase [Candidimonas sp. SYP-B2681]|uniref:TauD/TfdA dioxygenase family protein n=1 Tax=Candidimonas sp. SYP-B2681 TaxID=2497686 RepID=UPI000F878539|nr:TauD/TfdA family dioxygenase [Candidimonas sp. SYP-B2681]RTZ45512.1 TauD/TfdA family dioxygenase [Candidimonas sp. SYP-B2681]
MNNVKINPLAYAAGASVTGVDLRKPLTNAELEAVTKAWHNHLVLVFPEQNLTPQELIDFTSQFGQVERNDNVPYYRHPEFPEVLLVSNKPVDGKPSQTRNTGRNWHADLTYTDRPAKGSALLCKEKPNVGGDTMFANLYMAYDTLSPVIRNFIDTLEAVHDITLIKGFSRRDPAQIEEMRRLNPPIAHPVVRIHPETDKKLLFISERVRNFVGMSEEESQPILDFLNRHATSPEFVFRHRWSVNDLVMWDNRATLHVALADFDQSQSRHMMRCSLLGERSGYVINVDEDQSAGSLKSALAAVS